jgi:hypothetical protein
MSLIDFSPVANKDVQILEFARGYTVAQLRDAMNGYTDAMLQIIDGLTDAQAVFVPHDPVANDTQAATEAEKHIGWTIGHLVVHVTASQEENAAFGSILARGIAVGGRLRYETPWESITTAAQCVARLEESRRICLAYLDTFPAQPHLDVHREMSPRRVEIFGEMNCIAAYLFGLYHTSQHIEQFREVMRQAHEAHPA